MKRFRYAYMQKPTFARMIEDVSKAEEKSIGRIFQQDIFRKITY